MPTRVAFDYVVRHSASLIARLAAGWTFANCWREALENGTMSPIVGYAEFYKAARMLADMVKDLKPRTDSAVGLRQQRVEDASDGERN